jgi:hypothetical protein
MNIVQALTLQGERDSGVTRVEQTHFEGCVELLTQVVMSLGVRGWRAVMVRVGVSPGRAGCCEWRWRRRHPHFISPHLTAPSYFWPLADTYFSLGIHQEIENSTANLLSLIVRLHEKRTHFKNVYSCNTPTGHKHNFHSFAHSYTAALKTIAMDETNLLTGAMTSHNQAAYSTCLKIL